MRRPSLADSRFASFFVLSCFATSISFAQSVRLNGPLADAPGSVLQQATTPDGRSVVYIAQQDSGVGELYVAPIGGGPGERISAPLVSGEMVYRFVLAPDSRHVAYFVNGSNGLHLFGLSLADRIVVELDASADTDGRVLDDLHLGGLFVPDSSRVLYRAQVPTGEVRLFSASVAGGPPTLVSGPGGGSVWEARATPDSTSAVFSGDLDLAGRRELYRAPLDGSQTPVRLTPTPTRNSGLVGTFTLSSDGRFVVVASNLVSSRPVLWSLPLAGGTPIVLDPVSTAAEFPRADVTPDGTTVLFVDAPQILPSLFRAPIDGSAPAQLLSAGLSVAEFRLADDSQHAVFVTQPHSELYSVPVAGGAPVPLLAPGATLVSGSYAFASGGERVIFSSYLPGEGIDVLSVPVEGGGLLQLGRTSFGWTLSPDGRRVVFVDRDSRRLRIVGVRGGPPVELGAGGPAQFSGDSRRLLVLDDLDVPFRHELYQFAIVGGRPTKLSGPLAPLSDQGGKVLSYQPAGEDVFYLAQEVEYPGRQLFAAEGDGSARTRLDPPAAGTSVRDDWRTTPDGSRVVFVRSTPDGAEELYSSLAGGGDERRLSPAIDGGLTIRDFAVGPRGGVVAYLAEGQGQGSELYVVRTTGGPSLRVNGPLPPGGSVQVFAFAGSARLVYLADEEGPGLFRLYSVGLPGLVRTELNHALAPGEAIRDFVVGAGGAQVVYRTYLFPEITVHRVDSDGRFPATAVTMPDGSPARTEFLVPLSVTPDALEFTFRLDGHPFVAAFSGGAARAIGADVFLPGDFEAGLALDPTGARFCFRRSTGTENALYTAPRAGGPSSRVLAVNSASPTFRFTSDGSQLVFVTVSPGFQRQLNVVSSLGGASRKLVDVPFIGGDLVFELDPDGLRVAYLENVRQLNVMALDGLSLPRRVNELDVAIQDFHLGRERAFYLGAPPTKSFRVELFSRAYSTLP